MLGTMWRRTMRAWLKPAARAASMNGICAIDSVEDRAMRAIFGMIGSAMAAIRLKSTPNTSRLPSTATTTIASTMIGNDSMMSTTRWMSVVDAAAEIAGRRADQRAERAAEQRRQDADRQRRARAVDEPREHVAAVLVGAARGARAFGAGEHGGEVDRLGIVGRDPVGAERQHEIEQDHEEARRSPSGCVRDELQHRVGPLAGSA